MHQKTFKVFRLSRIFKNIRSRQDTLDLASGLGVTLPSTLLFILLFTSGLGAIPRHNDCELAVKLPRKERNIKLDGVIFV